MVAEPLQQMESGRPEIPESVRRLCCTLSAPSANRTQRGNAWFCTRRGAKRFSWRRGGARDCAPARSGRGSGPPSCRRNARASACWFDPRISWRCWSRFCLVTGTQMRTSTTTTGNGRRAPRGSGEARTTRRRPTRTFRRRIDGLEQLPDLNFQRRRQLLHGLQARRVDTPQQARKVATRDAGRICQAIDAQTFAPCQHSDSLDEDGVRVHSWTA